VRRVDPARALPAAVVAWSAPSSSYVADRHARLDAVRATHHSLRRSARKTQRSPPDLLEGQNAVTCCHYCFLVCKKIVLQLKRRPHCRVFRLYTSRSRGMSTFNFFRHVERNSDMFVAVWTACRIFWRVDWKCKTWKNGSRKTRGLTLQDLIMTDQIGGVEKAGPDNDGPNRRSKQEALLSQRGRAMLRVCIASIHYPTVKKVRTLCLFVLTWSTNVKKSPFSRTAAHIFVSPGDAPATIMQYVA